MSRKWFVGIVMAVTVVAGLLVAPTAVNAYWYGPASNLTATDLGGGQTRFSWDPPNINNYRGVAPSRYWVTLNAGSNYYYCGGNSFTVYASSCTVSGLPYGVNVTLSVRPILPYYAENAVASFVLCCSVPTAPASIVASASNGSASVTWSGPSNAGQSGSAFTYAVEIRPGGAVCSTDQNSCDIDGLVNGVSYVFFVSASNNSGTGPAAASQPVTPIGPPTEPLLVQSFYRKGNALVTWQGSAEIGGAPVNRYVVVSQPENHSCETSGALECRVYGLSSGMTYTFNVTAFNAAGQSKASAASEAKQLLQVASSPKKIRISRQGTSVTVRWKPPSSSGGSKIRKYKVTSSPQNKICNSKKAKPCRISGLKVGRSYIFSVQAINKSGLGAPGRSRDVYVPAPPKQDPGWDKQDPGWD